jgi:hypothetical protein
VGAAASEQLTRTTCPARAKSGDRCKLGAGHGTEHVGYGLCKFHGGASPGGLVQGAKLMAAARAVELDTTPHEAILHAVHEAARWERFCAQRVGVLEDEELVVARTRTVESEDGVTTTTESRAELNLWLREHRGAVRDLAHIAKVAVDAGVEERRVRLAEQLVGEMTNAFDLLLTRLGVRDHPDAPAAVRAALALVEAPKAIAERSAA